MRLAWMAILGGAIFMSGRSTAAGLLPLADCRLEHPLKLASVAARCATLEVPENPARPDGATLGLRVAVIPAVNRRSKAPPLFVLAGGPGQAATDLYVGTASAFARINRNQDIVLVDQRGTGGSAPLFCAYPEDWDGGGTDELPGLRAATRSCLARHGDRVRFYTTSIAVLDLDRVRRALGYEHIDLYASSYGTRVAQHYMRRHPEATHAVVLDGVVVPEDVIGPQAPADGERALELIVGGCAATPACAAAFPALSTELKTLRRRFGPERQPLTIADPGSGLPLEILFGRRVLNAALRLLSYSGGGASLVPVLLHEAAGGDLAPLAAQSVMLTRQVGNSLAVGMQNTVICSEDVPSFAVSEAERRALTATYQGTDQLDALGQICQEWPRGPVDADLHRPLRSAIPTLLLSGEVDPVTPPGDAERAARGLLHHRLLVLAGEGHGQLATGCVPQLIARFLADADAEHLDTHCLERHRSPPYFLATTGPAP